MRASASRGKVVNARPFSLKSATVKAHTVNKQPILFLLLIIAIVQLAEGGRNDDVMALIGRRWHVDAYKREFQVSPPFKRVEDRPLIHKKFRA